MYYKHCVLFIWANEDIFHYFLALYHYLFRMTYCITLRRRASKLIELVPNPFDNINEICSKRVVVRHAIRWI